MLRVPLARQRVGRRPLLRAIFASFAGIAAAEVVAAVAPFLRVTRVEGFGGPVVAGRLDDILASFAATRDRPILNRAGRFFLLHPPGGIVAAYTKCTHLGCTVPFNDAEDRFHCPCHQSVYDKRTAVVISGPAPRPLSLFHVRQENGALVVQADPLELIERSDNRWDATHLEIRTP